MKRQARLPRPVSVVLLVMAVVVAAGAAPAQAGSVRAAGSHESQARAEFRAPARTVVVRKAAVATDPPFMCRDKGQAPVDDWD
jgi:hypothetical protein